MIKSRRKVKVVVCIETDLSRLVETNYIFSLRIKSNLESEPAKSRLDTEYVRLDRLGKSEIERGDVFVFYKSQFFLPQMHRLISVLKKLGKTVLYDIDDYILSIPEYSLSNTINSEKRNRMFIRNLRNADAVIASTVYLGKLLSLSGADITVIENTASSERFKKPPKVGNTLNVLISSSDNLKIGSFKEEFIRCLLDLKAKYKSRIKFHFAGRFFNIPSLGKIADVSLDKTTPDRYEHFLSSSGIHAGLAPLGGKEDPQTHDVHSCKSNIKFIEFASFGIAGIYSRTEPYRGIKNGIEGFIVDNKYSSWFSAVEKLINDKTLAAKIAINSQIRVKKDFLKKKSSAKWLKLITSLSRDKTSPRECSVRFSVLVGLFFLRISFKTSGTRDKIRYARILLSKGQFNEFLRLTKRLFFK